MFVVVMHVAQMLWYPALVSNHQRYVTMGSVLSGAANIMYSKNTYVIFITQVH